MHVLRIIIGLIVLYALYIVVCAVLSFLAYVLACIVAGFAIGAAVGCVGLCLPKAWRLKLFGHDPRKPVLD